VRIDLSGALMVATANDEKAIAPPLRDRMHFIRMPSYDKNEQIAIAQDYILPRMFKRLGLTEEVQVSGEAIETLVKDFPATEGLRQVEQRLEVVVSRALRVHLLTGGRIHVGPDLVRTWLRRDAELRRIGFRVAGNQPGQKESSRAPVTGRVVDDGLR
jgi:ATP-dependent Lon protease